MVPLIGRGGGTVEYRFRHRDGHYIWIQDTFKVVYDDAGRPLELVGAWADITESKEAEKAALQANAEIQETKRYLTRLIESSPDAIIATDKQGSVVPRSTRAPRPCSAFRQTRSLAGPRSISMTVTIGQRKSCSKCVSAAAPPPALKAFSGQRTDLAFQF